MRRKSKVLKRCQKNVSDGAEVRCPGRLFHRLAAETGKARLPTVVRLKDGTTSWSEFDNRSVDRDSTSAIRVTSLLK